MHTDLLRSAPSRPTAHVVFLGTFLRYCPPKCREQMGDSWYNNVKFLSIPSPPSTLRLAPSAHSVCVYHNVPPLLACSRVFD